ncbi:hypothetical protein B0H15DRAFT_1021065 [Mycena belliarum]|uniref:Uncharacterized protein n=1 Tax=Mycena belliarum TaxID=1033014 RepID=A0AAD6U9E1_9AGAR|nr:hypothetical protein B0H15DRAFT_1021065 [Mycena belliae]
MFASSTFALLLTAALAAASSHQGRTSHNGIAMRFANGTESVEKRDSFTSKPMTWYPTNTGADACTGKNHQDSDWYVAMGYDQFGDGSGCCGRKLRINYNGKSAVATCVDECASCPEWGSIDLTKGLFTYLTGDPGIGLIRASWSYVDGNDGGNNNGGGNNDQTTTKKTTTKKTTTAQKTTTKAKPPPPTSTYTPPKETHTTTSEANFVAAAKSTSTSAKPKPSSSAKPKPSSSAKPKSSSAAKPSSSSAAAVVPTTSATKAVGNVGNVGGASLPAGDSDNTPAAPLGGALTGGKTGAATALGPSAFLASAAVFAAVLAL